MEEVLLLRYGELFLKGKNRGYFEKSLISNIKKVIQKFGATIQKTEGRYIVRGFDQMDIESVIDDVKKVFGLTSISKAVELNSYKEDIDAYIQNLKLPQKTFRVSVKRADKTFPISSNEYEKELGGYILDNNPHIKVALKDYDIEVMVDIRVNRKAYISTDRIDCEGGMPYGTSGNGLVLLSGGIDSPVSAYQMAKRGMHLLGLHFHSFPYTSQQAKEKVVDLAKILTKYTGHFRLICCPFTMVQEEIHKNCAPEYMITIMRRIMMKVAKEVCDKYSAQAIITGESLAQVASQTIESINVTNCSQITYPILRPLIAMDKTEIMDIAKKIGTYDTSILPYEDCCTVFLPKNPLIKPNLEKVIREESKLDINALVAQCIENLEIIDL